MNNFQKDLSQRVFLDAYALVFYTDKGNCYGLLCKTKEQSADAYEAPRCNRELVLVEDLADYLVNKTDQDFVCVTEFYHRRDYREYHPDNAVDFHFCDEDSMARSLEYGAGLLPHIKHYWILDMRDKEHPQVYRRDELAVKTVRQIIPINS